MTARYYTTSTPPACSCPDWQYRGSRTGRPCKHIRRLRAAETLVAAHAAKWRGRAPGRARTGDSRPGRPNHHRGRENAGNRAPDANGGALGRERGAHSSKRDAPLAAG